MSDSTDKWTKAQWLARDMFCAFRDVWFAEGRMSHVEHKEALEVCAKCREGELSHRELFEYLMEWERTHYVGKHTPYWPQKDIDARRVEQLNWDFWKERVYGNSQDKGRDTGVLGQPRGSVQEVQEVHD